MALYGMADNNVEIPAKRDGAMYNTFAGNTDFVIAGVGNEFEITSSATSFVLTLGTGEGIVCGRHVTEVTENGSNSMIQLEPNSSGYVVIRMDLSRPAGTEAYFTTVQVLQREDLNSDGTICDLPLYGYVTGENGVTSFIDIRDVVESAGGGSKNLAITLLANGWSGTTYTINNINIVTKKNVTITYPVLPDTEEANAQFEALRSAEIRPTSFSDGRIVLTAFGDVPSINLNIILIIWG